MKHYRLFTYALLAVALVSCQEEITPQENPSEEQPEATYSFTAHTDGTGIPKQSSETKATVGFNVSGKPQTFWENGDKITVYSSAITMSGDNVGYIFETSLSSNSTSATFCYADTDFQEGKYLAIYPHRTTKRIVNFNANPDNSNRYEGNAYRMAQVDVPHSQTLVAGGFQKNAAVAVAYSDGGTALNFKNAVALIKFRVADDDVVSGSVTASDKISGTFRADVLEADGIPLLMEYSAKGISQYTYVNFTAPGNAPLSTTSDYYVAVRPTDLTDGFTISLNGKIAKKYDLAKFERNKIYDLGTLGTSELMTLTFDFTGNPFDGWPSAPMYTHVEGGVECTYPLDGTDYAFVLADCGGAAAAQVHWQAPSGSTPGYLSLYSQYRYVGFPAVEGYALASVICVNASTSGNPKMAVTNSIVASADEAKALNGNGAHETIVSGGGYQTWQKGGTYTYTLSDTYANTVYYLYAAVKGNISSLTLGYRPVARVNLSVTPSSSDAPYTAATHTFDVNADGAWTVALRYADGSPVDWAAIDVTKGNGNAAVAVTVKENEYANSRTMILVVEPEYGDSQEVTLVQAGNPASGIEYKELELRVGTYNLKVASLTEEGQNNWLYRRNRVMTSIRENDFDIFGVQEVSTLIQSALTSSVGDVYGCKFFSPYSQDGNGDKAQGILYKKSEYTLSDWHYFWPSENPDVMSTNDSSGDNTYSRGGCCAVLTHKTTGLKIFFMVTHGFLNATQRETYAYVYTDREAMYNTDGYPSFFVGDMNARPADAATVEYLKYWNDTYLELDPSFIRGPFGTFNGFDLELDPYTDKRRIDYVYYRNNVTPLEYVCNTTKYDGYYASDHFPVYADMKIGGAVEK